MKLFYDKNELVGIALYNSSKELPEDWNELLPEGHFLNPQELALNESAGFPDLKFVYALISYKGKPAAVAYFQVLYLKEKHINEDELKPWQRILWKTFAQIRQPKLLVAGHLFRHDIETFFASSSLSSFEAFLCYRSAIDAALGRSCASAVLVKDMPGPLVPYFQNHAPQFLLLRNDISMELSIPDHWKTMEDYEKALKHKYAQRFRKVRKERDCLTVKELSVEEISRHKDRLYDLYLQVVQKQPVKMGYLSPDYLVLLAQHDPELKVWAVYEEDKIIAFLSAWLRDDTLDMFYIGFDYERNAGLQLYFNILFLSLEQAILHQKGKLILGRTALDAKARLGCKPRYLHTFLFIRNPLARNWVLKSQRRLNDGDTSWEDKHPLRLGNY